ncbi:MAG: NUDIX hydrolase [Sumerlaeia bacterium]
MNFPDHKKIIQVNSTKLVQNFRIEVYEDEIKFPSGKPGVHWRVHYMRCGVGVIPCMPNGNILLGLHHRYTTQQWGWEIVAGSMDPAESAEQTARRELLEETAFTANELTYLFTYNPAPGLGDETFYAYLAKGLTKQEVDLDADEIYEVKEFTWDEIVGLIERGEMQDGFSITLLSFARARGLI